jgi:hypothetical protein
MKKSKSIKVEIPSKSWEIIATKDIKYESIPYLELMQWIMNSVPQGTDLKDIKLEFDIDYKKDYYDEFTIDAEMHLKIYK